MSQKPRATRRGSSGESGAMMCCGRAERIVLVTVLDVRDAVAIEEPRIELDARDEALVAVAPSTRRARATSRIARKSSFTASQWNSMSWLPWTSESAWPSATNARERLEDVGMALGDARAA